MLPSRVSDALLGLNARLRAQILFVVHANHTNEIAADCKDALVKLVKSGVPVLNQAVLLRGINDSVTAQEALCRSLVNIGAMPYYLHQLDRVAGSAHFEADVGLGRKIIEELRTRLPGYAVPRFVQEIPGKTGKTPL